ncbi:MAG: hypothetical protein ACSHYF_05000 [Verrucomicrobiaceae bacterium]
MSRKKLRRDREAGLHFHWHLPQGSFGRLMLGAAVSTVFWGGLLAYVQVRPIPPAPLPDKATELHVVDLDQDANRWLSEIVDRASPYSDRWDVNENAALDDYIEERLAEVSLRNYRPTLVKIDAEPKPEPLRGLPGMGPGFLPPVKKVPLPEVRARKPEWWIEAVKIDGEGEWKPVMWRWDGEVDLLSPGERWTYQVGLDWRGRVISFLPLAGHREMTAGPIGERLERADFPGVGEDGEMRWWILEATAVDRSVK